MPIAFATLFDVLLIQIVQLLTYINDSSLTTM